MRKCVLGEISSGLRNIFYDDANFIQKAQIVLKDDRSSTVGVFRIENRLCVIKRSNIRGMWHALKCAPRRSRAMRQFQNAIQLLQASIPTARPIAAVETYYGPWRGTSFYVAEYLPGIQAREFFSQADRYKSQWLGVARKIVQLMMKLKRERISHRDLNLSNILIHQGEPSVIDLDSMRRHHFNWSAEWGAWKDKTRFMHNWRNYSDILPEAEAIFIDLFKTEFKRSTDMYSFLAQDKEPPLKVENTTSHSASFLRSVMPVKTGVQL